MFLTIIIPAYNEQERIKPTLEQYLSFYQDAQKVEFLVVVNGSRDNTLAVVKAVAQEHPGRIRYINIPEKIGKGGALRRGFSEAKSEYVGFVDADASTTPEEFDKVVRAAKEVDGAIASRWKKGSEIVGGNLFRELISFGFIVIVKILFGMPFEDTQCGAKVFKGTVIRKIISSLRVNNMAFDVELLYRLNRKGYAIEEIPSVWVDYSSSSMALGSPYRLLQNIVIMFITLIKIRLS